MDLQQFTQDAKRTEAVKTDVQCDLVKLRHVFDAFIAAGTMLDMLKKNMYYGKPVSDEKWDAATKSLFSASSSLNTNGLYKPLVEHANVDVDTRLLHGVVGIATESVELVEALHRSIFSQQSVDKTNVGEELFDAMWYAAICVDTCGLSWDNLLNAGIAKLRDRYPEKFDEQRAINRDVDMERNTLSTMWKEN